MDRDAMVEVARRAIARQDEHDTESILELFAADVRFMMPVLDRPLEGRDALRQSIEQSWPESSTAIEWTAVDGDRLVCCWSWRGKGADWPEDSPPLRGVSTFVFDEDGLVSDYEDRFDPDWMSRHAGSA